MKPGNLYDMSATSQRRIIKQVEETIIGKFNCDQTQALQIAQMYSARSTLNVTPSFINRKRTNENPASNSSIHDSSSSHLKITSQYKAWNDTIRMAMYIDLILKPLAASRGGKFFLWMDNVSSHKTDILDAIFKEANIEVGFFPPNMTQFLQILDLIVNGALKAHIRRTRGESILHYFRHYRDLYNAELEKPADARIMPQWSPPKPTVQECILELIHVMYDSESKFSTQRFKDNVQKTFLNTGTFPKDDGTFTRFSFEPSGGTTSIAPTGTNEKYSKCQSEIEESQGNDLYTCEFQDVIENWIFDESLDDFDVDIFDSDTLQLQE